MIVVRTKNKVTLTQAKAFEDSQAEQNLLKKAVFDTADCKWELRVVKPVFNPFQASVQWYQLQEHLSEGDEGTVISPILMFSENFILDEAETNDLFTSVGISIIAGTDNLTLKLNEIVTLGVLHWIGNIREVFGLGVVDFEIV